MMKGLSRGGGAPRAQHGRNDGPAATGATPDARRVRVTAVFLDDFFRRCRAMSIDARFGPRVSKRAVNAARCATCGEQRYGRPTLHSGRARASSSPPAALRAHRRRRTRLRSRGSLRRLTWSRSLRTERSSASRRTCRRASRSRSLSSSGSRRASSQMRVRESNWTHRGS